MLYIKTKVKGLSMQPTINTNLTDDNSSGDTIYINQYANITNDDIVVAKVDWHTHYIIKRVVGVPGDKIEIKDENTHYAVYVNNSLLYTKNKYGDASSYPKTGSYGYYENYLKFLSNPSFQQWVKTDENGSYIQLGENDFFLLGDNWGHTTDSLTKGPIKTNEIIGRVDCILDVSNTNPLSELQFFLKKLFS